MDAFTALDAIFQSLRSINDKHGKGEIDSIRIDRYCKDGFPYGGLAYRRMTSFTDVRKFTVSGNTVSFLGRSRKIKG